jgi:phage shock protein A
VYWGDKAREAVQANDEDQARLALVRKREHEDLLASLEHSLKAAAETVEHLSKTYRALSARLSESHRKAQVLASGGSLEAEEPAAAAVDVAVADEIEDELAALKREMGLT